MMTGASFAQAKGELTDVKLRVYLFPIGSPSAYFTNSMDRMYGLDVDIITELRNRLGFDFKYDRIFPIDYVDGLARLEKNEIDLLGGSMLYTEQRSKTFALTPIYLNSCLTVAYSTLHHKEIKSVKDLKGLRIGTDFNSSEGAFVELIKSFGAEPVEISNISYALLMVAQNRLDGVLYDRLPLEDFAQNVKSARLEVIDDVIGMDKAKYTFYMPKKSPYRFFIIDAFQAMIDDGTMDRLLRKWKVSTVEINEDGQPVIVRTPKEREEIKSKASR